MAEAKKKSPYLDKGSTPVGVLVFPHLQKPDVKFNADGEFHTKVRLSGEAAAPLVEKLDKLLVIAFDKIVEEKSKGDEKEAAKLRKTMKRADPPYKKVVDDNGDETGDYTFSFKQKAKITTKAGEVIEKKVGLFDAAKQPIGVKPLIYGGSEAKVAYGAIPFFTPAVGAGLSLRLLAVQVLKLRTAGSADAESYGFEEEGGGIDTPTPFDDAKPGDAPAAGDAAGGDEF